MDSCIMDRASIGRTPLEAAAKALRICDELIEDGNCNNSIANAISHASNVKTPIGALANPRAHYLAVALEERLRDTDLIGQLRETLATLQGTLAQKTEAGQ
jgi:adenylate kinase family enzyme